MPRKTVRRDVLLQHWLDFDMQTVVTGRAFIARATADVVRGRNIEAARRSECAKEFNQVALLLAG
jgi:hypothetical protein